MPGVKIVEEEAFHCCEALTDVECERLEIIEEGAFCNCISLRSINLKSARIIEEVAFVRCEALTDLEFGNELERIDEGAFGRCISLKRITIPLKDGMFTDDDIFSGCAALTEVDLVEGALHETIAALHLEDWRQRPASFSANLKISWRSQREMMFATAAPMSSAQALIMPRLASLIVLLKR